MMDLEEWELLPDDGFLEIHDDGGKKIFSRKYGGGDPRKNVFKTNYFICPSPKSPHTTTDPPPANRRVPNQLVPVPINIGKAAADDHELVKQVVINNNDNKVPIDHHKVKAPNNIGGAVEAGDQETVSQVFFKKMKENEFVDMKMDSPKSSGRGIVPPMDAAAAAATFQFEDTSSSEAYKGEKKIEKETVNKKTNLESVSKEEDQEEEVNSWEDKNEVGLNIWKRSMTGIGAICSFGVAAATICIIICGSHHKNKQQQHHQQNQKLRFQIYADDKRIKQVVHHATKLNEAISAVRSHVPLTRAHITVGGYYDGL